MFWLCVWPWRGIVPQLREESEIEGAILLAAETNFAGSENLFELALLALVTIGERNQKQDPRSCHKPGAP